jgi:hypothetical protein
MKTSLKLIALLLAAGYPCVAFAEFLGARVPSVINAENTVALFSAALVALLMLGDYARRRTFSVATANELAFKHEKHRLAA